MSENDEIAVPAGEAIEPVAYDFELSRRGFVGLLGAGLLVSAAARPAISQQAWRRGGRRRPPMPVSARIHVATGGTITVLAGKVEVGQGARAELTQAAAEELRVPPERVRLVLGDTTLAPDDGITAGSRTTPSTVPAVRRAAAAAREILVRLACGRLGADPSTVAVEGGQVIDGASGRAVSYGELAGDDELVKAFAAVVPEEVTVTAASAWRVLGVPLERPNARDLVTGTHRYPSDQVRPGVVRGKVLRPPAYGARLVALDLEPARAMDDVVVVQDGQFAGVAAPTAFAARRALEAIARTARWEEVPQPASDEVFDHLLRRSRGGIPENPFAAELARAHRSLRAQYRVAYVQHAPLEPRAALAEWKGGDLTVWTGTQNPLGVRRELAQTFRLPPERVRVVVPDTGGGFGGKHTGEVAVEAARLAQAAGRPVAVEWTREEEFTWAYFRPAALIHAEASLDERGALTSWYFVNVNAGSSAIDPPYRTGKARTRFVRSEAPLRQGSYRALAATANTFARECFMDELAAAAGADPLEFRRAHLEDPRLRAVLEEAARRFGWSAGRRERRSGTGVGLACGTEKGSYVAACVEVEVDGAQRRLSLRRVSQAFECGAILDPRNLRAQVEGCIVMGLGPALREEVRFREGRVENASFSRYRVPRLSDVPEIEVHLLDRKDLPPAGAGETPIIAIAPAIAAAVRDATGVPVREMPVRLPPAGAGGTGRAGAAETEGRGGGHSQGR